MDSGIKIIQGRGPVTTVIHVLFSHLIDVLGVRCSAEAQNERDGVVSNVMKKKDNVKATKNDDMPFLRFPGCKHNV